MMKVANLLFFWILIPVITSAQGGDILYKQYCSQCHGQNREGGIGPNLIDKEWAKVQPQHEKIVEFINHGSVKEGMPAWKGVIDDEKISAIARYVLSSQANGEVGLAAQSKTRYPELAAFRLPAGFSISVYSEGVESARSLAVSPSGIIFVGSRKAGKIYAVTDNNKDFVADKVVTVAEGLDSPIGVTLVNGALYVAEISRIIRFDDIEKNFEKKPSYKVVKNDLPKDKWHGEKIIKSGPDGKLYFEIGAPCNVCDKESEPYAKIYRMNLDGSDVQVFAKGVRNSVGFAWHPATKEMWFTDNGRDELGDNLPSCELNRAPTSGLHFGFPYCHSGVMLDPDFGKNKNCDDYSAPAANLGPHVAPLGLAFNDKSQFPAHYKNQLFIAEHGSWNRTQKSGYRVALITLFNNKVVSDTVFVDGFLQNEEVIGRPVDIAFLQDGSMLISDDYRGRIYRVSYRADQNKKSH